MKSTFFILFIFVFIQNSNAQTVSPFVLNSAGGTLQNGAFVSSYSVGEPVVMTFSNSSNSVTSGILQPAYGTLTGTSSKHTPLTFSAYPNPAQDHLYIEGGKKIHHVIAYDLTGKQSAKINVVNNTVNLSSLNSGSYILQFYNEDNTLEGISKITKI